MSRVQYNYMAIAQLGEENSGDKRTPTLRQFIKEQDGNYPIQSNVKMIFKPNQYGGYTFITDHNFKVQLEKGSPTQEYLEMVLDELFEREATLVIQPIVEKKKVSFLLGEDTDSNSSWEITPWGFRLSLLPPKNQTGKKKQPPRKTMNVAHEVPVD